MPPAVTAAPVEGDDWKKVTITVRTTPISTTDPVFADFPENGDFDVYFYFTSSTGNISPNSAKLDVTMN